jgi:hypothetical protein
MHYWGYVIETVIDVEPIRSSRRAGARQRATAARNNERGRWSRTAPWL